MKKFPFLRRPVRLILYAVLLALVTTAALVFAWQYKLDGIVLDHAIDTYAYVGTVVRTDGAIMDSYVDWEYEEVTPVMGGPAFLEEIPEELVQWLYDSEHVARIDNRRTLAGMAGEYHRAKAQTNATGQTSKAGASSTVQYYFLEGTIVYASIWDPDWDRDVAVDTYQVTVDRMWGDPDTSTKKMVVRVYRTAQEASLEVGQRIFLMGQIAYSGSGTLEGQTTVDTAAYTSLITGLPFDQLTIVQRNPYIVIPDGVDSEACIQDFLGSTGLDAMLERQLNTLYTVSLLQTQDMMMIPLFIQGKALTYEGRVLTPSDMGKKVCVIPFYLSYRNNLSVGDTIQLSAADGCYVSFDRETGDPGTEDVLLEQGEYETYEIVGIYSQKGYVEGNNLYFAPTDIFIPAQEDTAAETVRPYAFSFRVPGPEYLAFLEEFQPVLDEYGYSLIVEDTGWDDVKETFYTMQSRRQLMLLCAGLAFAAAVLVFAVLLNAHCRYEYGLRRLMGATKREAVGIYGSVFAFTAVPGAVAAVCASWFMAVRLIGQAMEGDAMIPVPTNAECAQTLLLWAALELAAALAVLLILALRGERKGLLRLIRR